MSLFEYAPPPRTSRVSCALRGALTRAAVGAHRVHGLFTGHGVRVRRDDQLRDAFAVGSVDRSGSLDGVRIHGERAGRSRLHQTASGVGSFERGREGLGRERRIGPDERARPVANATRVDAAESKRRIRGVRGDVGEVMRVGVRGEGRKGGERSVGLWLVSA